MSTPKTDTGIGAHAPSPPSRRVHRGARARRGALAVAAVVVALVVALPILAGVVTQPVRSVRISGEFAQVSKTDFERAVEPLLTPGLLRIDVEALRHAALDVPWVHEVKVRRVWPGGLDISVVERDAVARWAGGGYLERDGTHFRPGGGAAPDALPVLAGPEGMQPRVLALHDALERMLVPFGMRLAAIELTPRGVLYATLDRGLRLVMRPGAVEEGEVAIYAKTIAALMADRLHEIERIDFRYPNGFAVRVRTAAPVRTGAAGGGGAG